MKKTNFNNYLRKEHNITLKELALKTGIPYHTLQKYSQRVITPSPDRIRVIADALIVKPAEIVFMLVKQKGDIIMTDTNQVLFKSLLEVIEENIKLKEQCESLEKQLLEQTSSAIVYKDLFNEAKRVVGEDLLYRLIYENIDE